MRDVERQLKLRFPKDYAQFLLMHNGGRPDPCDVILTLDNEQVFWAIHYFFGIDYPFGVYSLQYAMELTRETRPPGTVPIACDDFGNFFYMRWDIPEPGRIYFGPTPSNFERVQLQYQFGTFSEFLAALTTEVPPSAA